MEKKIYTCLAMRFFLKTRMIKNENITFNLNSPDILTNEKNLEYKCQVNV